MTNREEQLLRWIEENPMISQQELADKAGITRSSVAVHISNLMKKGYIAGKGYVVQTAPYAVVIGGLNKDIGGKPFDRLIGKDSNPGKVNTSIGGVGHNIAHNMALLGMKVNFLTALGDDEFTSVVTEMCSQVGIEIGHALRMPGMPSATYLFVAGPNGDMEIAISDMEIFNHLTPDYFEKNIALLNRAKVVIADTNIPQDSLEWLCDNCEAPIFVDPVSIKKAGKLKNVLGKVHTLKPNRLEAELLSGVKITDEESLRLAAENMLSTGLKRVFISLSEDGVYCADGNTFAHLPCPEANLVNTTGGGDAFMAGLIWSYFNHMDLIQSAKIGGGAAAIAVETSETINSGLNIEEVLRRADFV